MMNLLIFLDRTVRTVFGKFDSNLSDSDPVGPCAY